MAMGAAQRRRQRRLRSWLRHEQQTVAAVLATVSHHSFPKVDTAHDGLRALRTVTSTREGVEHEKHVGLRAQKRPLPGVRPGSLLDPGPQRSDRTVRPSLAGGGQVDPTTSSFLLRENLKLQKEEEERRRKRVEAEYEAHMQELDRRVHADVPLTPAESRAWRKTSPCRGGERKRGRRKTSSVCSSSTRLSTSL